MFEDLLVIDAATFLAGPGAATVLGDYGARVVKIEPPAGDGYRNLKGTWPIDYNWLLTSRNKESLALDISKPEGREIIHALVAKADIFVTNFIGEHLTRYEYEYERLISINPRLVYAHVTGYGVKGPDVSKRAFDATAWWARSGLMEFVRDKGIAPISSAPGMGDHATSMSLFSAIVAALYRREKTGKGGYVSTSLLANGVWSNGMNLQGVLAGIDLGARRQASGMNNPFASVYQAKDGGYVLFSIVNAEREWPQLARALGRSEWLDDERFSSVKSLIQNRFVIIEMIQEVIGAMPISETVAKLEEYEVTHSYVMPMGEVVDDPQVAANDMIVKTGDKNGDYERTVMSPIHIDQEEKRTPKRAPDIGADSRTVLKSLLDLTDEKIESLIAHSVILEPPVSDR